MNYQNLPLQPIGREGMICPGTITYVVNPWEFYTVPEDTWECLCKEDERTPGDPMLAGLNGLISLTKTLTDYCKGVTTLTSEMTEPNALVAVKYATIFTEISNTTSWYRGRVLTKTNEKSNEMTQSTSLTVFLIDIGLEIPVPDSLTNLPDQFTHYPPFAFKCSLFGISPVYHSWTKSAVNTMKYLTLMQPCLIELKRCGQPETSSHIPEVPPSHVSVTVKFKDQFYDVATVLEDYGLGLMWNMTPGRPLVSEYFKGEIWNLMCAENEKPGASLHAHATNFDDEAIKTRERNRLEKLLARLRLKEPCDTDGIPEELTKAN